MTYPHLKTKGKKVQGVDEEAEEKECNFIELGALEVETGCDGDYGLSGVYRGRLDQCEDTGAQGLRCPPRLTVPLHALSTTIASLNNQADTKDNKVGVAKNGALTEIPDLYKTFKNSGK